MKILILGAGRVGSSLASTLSKQQYEVSVVDLNKDKLQRLQEDFDLATEVGHGSYPSTLKKAGADEETILLAVTNSDECNITSCQIAKSKFNVKKTICRLSNASYLDSLDAFGEDNIDIAIDLMGYTFNNRAAIFSHRIAPIQVNYLGWGATTGNQSIDYI